MTFEEYIDKINTRYNGEPLDPPYRPTEASFIEDINYWFGTRKDGDRYRFILPKRCTLFGVAPLTQRQICVLLKVSGGRVHQLEARAIFLIQWHVMNPQYLPKKF